MRMWRSDPAAQQRWSTGLTAEATPRDEASGRRLVTGIRHGLRQAWRFLRQASGDDAYDRYLAHMKRAHPDKPVMSRGAYFRARQDQRWNGISRCC